MRHFCILIQIVFHNVITNLTCLFQNSFSFFKIRHCCILNYIVSLLHTKLYRFHQHSVLFAYFKQRCHRNYMYGSLDKINHFIYIVCSFVVLLMKDHIYGAEYMHFISCELKELMHCVPQCELWQGTHKLVNQISKVFLSYTIDINDCSVVLLH